MLILARQDVELLKAKQATNPAVLLRYRRKIYRRISHFGDIDAAIADCREKLDSGEFCLVLQDGLSGQEVWQSLNSEELQTLRGR